MAVLNLAARRGQRLGANQNHFTPAVIGHTNLDIHPMGITSAEQGFQSGHIGIDAGHAFKLEITMMHGVGKGRAQNLKYLFQRRNDFLGHISVAYILIDTALRQAGQYASQDTGGLQVNNTDASDDLRLVIDK